MCIRDSCNWARTTKDEDDKGLWTDSRHRPTQTATWKVRTVFGCKGSRAEPPALGLADETTVLKSEKSSVATGGGPIPSGGVGTCPRPLLPEPSAGQDPHPAPATVSANKPLKIFFGNITSWSLKAKQRILSQEVDICGVAEHHQAPSTLAPVQSGLADGWLAAGHCQCTVQRNGRNNPRSCVGLQETPVSPGRAGKS